MKGKFNRNVIYVLAFLQGLVFYSSIATLYRTTHGITLLEMGIIESIFSIFMIVLEIPWGYVCDRIGYKKTMIIANCFYFLSKIVFWKSYGFAGFLFERLLLAVSVTGLSGCDSSLLYLSTTPEEATGVYGKQNMFGVIGMVVASLSFSFVFKTDIELAAFATIIPYFIAFILTFFLEDIRETQEREVSIKTIFQSLLKNKSIIIVLAASALLTDSTHTLTVFYNQLQYERVGIPLEYYGIIFMLLQFVGMRRIYVLSNTFYHSKRKCGCGIAGNYDISLFIDNKLIYSIHKSKLWKGFRYFIAACILAGSSLLRCRIWVVCCVE